MKRSRIFSLIIFFIISSFVYPQTLKTEFPAEQQIDVIENLGKYVPLDAEFIDEDGKVVKLASFFESEIPTVLTLNYFECPMLCTLVLNGLAESLKNLTLNAGEDFQVITIDINPNEKTLFANQKKKNYVNGFGLQNIKDDWHFLTGDQVNIKKVADSIGYIYYYDNQRDEYMHPAAITLLSPEGKISRYLYGIEYPTKDLKLGLLEASEGKIGSTLDKIILYCYHYDPYKNTYTIFATNIMRLGGIFTIIFLGIMLVGYWKKDKNLFDKGNLNVR
jgi:protein SCO1/2